jgi:hypothetical protein
MRAFAGSRPTEAGIERLTGNVARAPSVFLHRGGQSAGRVLDFGQWDQKRGEFRGNLGSSDSDCLLKSQKFCVAGILRYLPEGRIPPAGADRCLWHVIPLSNRATE